MELVVGGKDGVRLEGDTESALEEISLEDDDDQSNGRQSQVKTVRNSVSEDLSKIPGIWCHGGKDAINGERHDGTVIKESDNQDHERRELELVGKDEDGEADDDTDGNGAGVDGVVPHTLEDDTRSADGVNDGR